jgi:hypothetical protein
MAWRILARIALLVVALTCLPHATIADTIVLKDGTILKGTIAHREDLMSNPHRHEAIEIELAEQPAGSPLRRIPIEQIDYLVIEAGGERLVFDLAMARDAGGPGLAKSRKGFVFGGGFGGQYTGVTQSVLGRESRDDTVGPATDAKIGFGLSDRLLLFLNAKSVWVDYDNAFGHPDAAASHVGCFSISFYEKSRAPSTYLVAGVGYSGWSAPFEFPDSWEGVAYLFGFGFEYDPHWSVEIALTRGNPLRSEFGFEFESNTTSVVLTLVGLYY